MGYADGKNPYHSSYRCFHALLQRPNRTNRSNGHALFARNHFLTDFGEEWRRRRRTDTDREMITLLSKSKGGNSATFAANFPTFPDLVAFPNPPLSNSKPSWPLFSAFDTTISPVELLRSCWVTLNLNFIDKTHNEYECKPVLKKSRQKGLRECLSRCSAGLTFTAFLESDYLSKRRTGSPPPPFGKQMYPSWGAISA